MQEIHHNVRQDSDLTLSVSERILGKTHKPSGLFENTTTRTLGYGSIKRCSENPNRHQLDCGQHEGTELSVHCG